MRKHWVDKASFDWGPEQRESFLHIQKSISDHAMSGSARPLQHHLATDASKHRLRGGLFQLPVEVPGTEVVEKHNTSFCIIMCMLFWLEEAEFDITQPVRELWQL